MLSKDTVIKHSNHFGAPAHTDATLERQAEISFKAGMERVVPFVEKFLEIAEHGNYSNGNTANGVDEGDVLAWRLINKWKDEWQDFLKENELEMKK